MLLVPACFSEPGCDVSGFLECENDFECGTTQVCEAQIIDSGCVEAEVCITDADCPDGVSCDQRPPTGPTHPFAGNTPNKKVCGCDPLICGTGGQGANGGVGDTGGDPSGGGAGGDGSGGDAPGGAGIGGGS